MINSGVIIASTACYLINTLREKINDFDFKVGTAGSLDDLYKKIKTNNPRFLFIENCFMKPETDYYIHKISKEFRDMRIIIWSLSEMSPLGAARLLNAGADSYFCLRETEEKIDLIIRRIVSGQCYCPDDVKAVIDKDNAFPVFGKRLTRRELQIIKMGIKYKTNQKIADAMHLSRAAVRFHKTNVYRKIGGETPVDILINGIKKGIILPEDLE
jgi:DNA-binding NarL/FixJ family response regulator